MQLSGPHMLVVFFKRLKIIKKVYDQFVVELDAMLGEISSDIKANSIIQFRCYLQIFGTDNV